MYKLASQSRQHANMPNRNTNGINSLCTSVCRLHLKCDGTRAETRFCLSAKRTSQFKSAVGTSVQSTTGSQDVRISGSNAGHTTFRGHVEGTGYPLHSPVSPSLPLPCITVCHHISTGLWQDVSSKCSTRSTNPPSRTEDGESECLHCSTGYQLHIHITVWEPFNVQPQNWITSPDENVPVPDPTCPQHEPAQHGLNFKTNITSLCFQYLGTW